MHQDYLANSGTNVTWTSRKRRKILEPVTQQLQQKRNFRTQRLQALSSSEKRVTSTQKQTEHKGRKVGEEEAVFYNFAELILFWLRKEYISSVRGFGVLGN